MSVIKVCRIGLSYETMRGLALENYWWNVYKCVVFVIIHYIVLNCHMQDPGVVLEEPRRVPRRAHAIALHSRKSLLLSLQTLTKISIEYSIKYSIEYAMEYSEGFWNLFNRIFCVIFNRIFCVIFYVIFYRIFCKTVAYSIQYSTEHFMQYFV